MASRGLRTRLFETARRVTARSGLLRYLTPTAATAIVVLFLLASSVPLMYWLTVTGFESQLAQSQSTWSAHGVRDYRYTVAARCACATDTAGPVRVSVLDGRFSESMALGATPVSAATPDARLQTIPDLFGLIASELPRAHRVEVDFDEAYGFPRRIEIDPSADELNDDMLILVTDFDPRPTSDMPR